MIMSKYGNAHPAIDTDRVGDERRCTTFTIEHGLTNPPVDAFTFAFVCPGCDNQNALKGDPHAFRGKLFRCLRCTRVSLVEATALDQFLAEVRDDA
jgi:hypothetical protein